MQIVPDSRKPEQSGFHERDAFGWTRLDTRELLGKSTSYRDARDPRIFY